MGLDLLPKACPCDKHQGRTTFPPGFTHAPKDQCPFSEHDLPLGILASCCWLRGQVAARELAALGLDDIAERLYADCDCQGAAALGTRLLEAAAKLEAEHRGRDAKPRGAGWSGRWSEQRKTWDWQKHSSFGEALARVREAADWYGKVGRLGFGVHAWH